MFVSSFLPFVVSWFLANFFEAAGCVPSVFFFRPTPCGFRQVVQQLSKTVANEINYLIRTGAVAVVAAKVNWKRTDT